MYELSGITCSGKSYIIKKISYDNNIPILKKKYWHFIIGLFYLFRTFNANKVVYIFKNSFKSDKRFIVILKVFFNVVCKFYYIHTKKNYIVDEGFLQIPFLLLLEPSRVDGFFKLFESEINLGCFYWADVNIDLNYKRLLERGHHRFHKKNNVYKQHFFKKNISIKKQCEIAFVKNNINVEVLSGNK